MGSRIFKGKWVGVYQAVEDRYRQSTDPILMGGPLGFHSYVGFDFDQIAEAIATSKTPAKVYLRVRTGGAGRMRIGMHKQVRNTKNSIIPGFRFTGIIKDLGLGQQRIDITTFEQDLVAYPGVNTFSEALDNGFKGLVLYGMVGENEAEASGITNNSNHIAIEVEGLWNTKPGKPVITYPVSGVSVDSSIELKGQAAKDSEQASSTLRYQWAIYDGSWHYLDLTSEGQVNRKVNFINYKETFAAKVRLRAYDGELYGDWVESDVFTINHNKAPAEPTNLSPRGGELVDRTQDIRFSWTHNDQDEQSRFNFRWRIKGAATWNQISRVTTNNYVLIPANTFPAGEIEWQVQTFDQRDLSSPYSSTVIFNAADATDAPVILNPAQNEIISEPNPIIQWSSVNQAHFQLEVLSGGNVIWRVEDNSAVKAYTIGEALSNYTDYVIRLRVRSDSGLWSEWSERAIHTSFTPPNQPEISLNVHGDQGSIEIAIVNPPEEGDTPATRYNEIFRKVFGSSEDYIKINAYSEPNEYWIDFTPGTGVIYEYKVRAWGANGSFMDSVPALGRVDFKETIIMLVSNPDYRVYLQYNPSRNVGMSVNRTMMEFNGRSFPVAEFGQIMNSEYDLSFDIREKEDIDLLYRLMESRQTLLYRDARGRRDFVTMDQMKVSDKFPFGYTVSFSLGRVDFVEGIK